MPQRAETCGGFFCQNVPVDQSGEHLLFGIEDDGTVVAHIQIQYQGAAEDFAWVLPLPAVPVVSVGSDEVFRTLRALTDVRFNAIGDGPDACWDDDGDGGGGEGEGEGEGEVDVLQEGAVGPYDTAVVSSDDSEELMTWLTDHDYDIPRSARPAVESYVNDDYVFLALRLQKDRAVGDLRPIVVRFEETGPCVPLRLTAIAATPDMPIYVFVLADGRAVSTNYLDVEPNWAAINWLRGADNYADVVRRAVDEATGHALVTEMAGAAEVLTDAFYWEGRFDLDALRPLDDAMAFYEELMSQGFTRSADLYALMRRFIPKPESLDDVSDDEFYGCLECYADELEGTGVDSMAFADALQAEIVQPLVDAQALADRHSYLTRLYTAISPEEMTEDPIFRFNMDLGDVPNSHDVEIEAICNGEGPAGATYRLTLPDGRILFVEPGDPGHPESDGQPTPDDMPASGRASQQSEAGPGSPLYDNGDDIDTIIEREYGAPSELPDDADVPDLRGHEAHGGACGALPSSDHEPAFALLLLALAAVLRRR